MSVFDVKPCPHCVTIAEAKNEVISAQAKTIDYLQKQLDERERTLLAITDQAAYSRRFPREAVAKPEGGEIKTVTAMRSEVYQPTKTRQEIIDEVAAASRQG